MRFPLAWTLVTTAQLLLLLQLAQLCAVGCDDPSGGGASSSPPPSSVPAVRATEAKATRACARGDLICEKDRLSYDAIKTLHEQLDDDKNGNVDINESEEFLREELQYKSEETLRRNNFHNKDTLISIADLWDMWIRSEVHNWTVDEVVHWLEYYVELPQYAATFRTNLVDGASLPRIASNSLGFVSVVLGIKNVVHRQKLCLKAMDTVLFGAPKVRQSLVKDILLATAIAVAIAGVLFARREYKMSQQNLKRWESDICSLQNLQEKLEGEQNEKKLLSEGKRVLEARIHSEMNEAKAEAERLRISRVQTETELTRLKLAEEELQKVREALADAEKQLELHRGSDGTPTAGGGDGQPMQLPSFVSAELQQWLQITFELEQRAYQQKKAAAEHELALAKEACEKLRRKKNAFLGSLRMAHSSTMDEFEYQIVHAKNAMEEVKVDFAERHQRWQSIEALTGIQVEINPGLASLASMTGHKYLQHKLSDGNLTAPLMSLDDVDELSDIHPGYAPVVARYASRGSLGRISRSQHGQSSTSLQQWQLQQQQQQQSRESDRPSSTAAATKYRVATCGGGQDDCSSLTSGSLSCLLPTLQPATCGLIEVDQRPQFTLYDEAAHHDRESVAAGRESASCDVASGSGQRQQPASDGLAAVATGGLPSTLEASSCDSGTQRSRLNSIDGPPTDDRCIRSQRSDLHTAAADSATAVIPAAATAIAAASAVVKPNSQAAPPRGAKTTDSDSSSDGKRKEKKKRSLFLSFRASDKHESALKNLAHKLAKERAKAATS